MIGAVDQKALEALFVYSWPGAVVLLILQISFHVTAKPCPHKKSMRELHN